VSFFCLIFLPQEEHHRLRGSDHSTSIVSQEDIRTEPSNEHRFIIKFKDRSRFDTAHFSLQSDPHFIMSLPEDDIEVMNLESEEEIKYWEERDDVDYIEPDQKVFLQAESIPWGITKVKALNISNDGSISNQKVCVIDSGYDIRHPDLPSSANIVSGTSQVRSEDWTEDGSSHGTHVAGTIAALRGNNIGVVGVAGNGVKLHIVKVFANNGKATNTSNLVQALRSCVDAGSTVVNMSLGASKFSRTANAAFSSAYNNGILLVAAAGNGGSTAKSYPASYSSVISVAAIDRNNNHASFSQSNDQVDLAAPGVGVLSTKSGGRYASFQGTSMASPHVAGVAALVWSQCPGKTAQEIRQVLESTAQDLGPLGRDNKFGHGLVRADLAYNNCKESGGNVDPIKGYEFTPFKDSFGYDIRKSSANSVQSYARECNQDSNCKGFNSNGWLKFRIRDSSAWYTWTNDASKGFYVKAFM
jgi:serine protease